MILFFTLIFTKKVIIKFVSNQKYLLTMEKPYKNKPGYFVPKTYTQLATYFHICDTISMRRITKHKYEFFFCGSKMCYNEMNNHLTTCKQNEHNSIWNLKKVGDNIYKFENKEHCITIEGSRVYMDTCNDNINQLLKLEHSNEYHPLNLNQNDYKAVRERKLRDKMQANVEYFKRESLGL